MGGVKRDGCEGKEDRRRRGRQRPMGKVEREETYVQESNKTEEKERGMGRKGKWKEGRGQKLSSF